MADSEGSSPLVTLYQQSIDKGRNLCRELLTFQQPIRNYSRMQDLYLGESNPLSAPGILQTSLAEWNVDPNRIVDVNVSTSTPVDTIYSNLFNAKDGVILNNENYKCRDTNPTGQRLWPSEVVWQSFLRVTAQENVQSSNL